MTARLLAFAIWAAVAATVVFWALRLLVDPPAAPSNAVAVGAAAPRGELTRLLGAGPAAASGAVAAAPSSNNRFKLVGVVAPREAGGSIGIALIAVDDKPARPYRVGAVVDNSWVVQAVSRRGVSLGPSGGSAELNLELPPLQAAATGALPPGPALRPPPVAAPVPPTMTPPAPTESDTPPSSPR